MLSVGDQIVITFASYNGATTFYPTSFSIDGAAQTVRWQGGTAPTGGFTNTTNIYIYTIVKIGSSSYHVYGSQTKFGV
jgi:hypothetical protein